MRRLISVSRCGMQRRAATTAASPKPALPPPEYVLGKAAKGKISQFPWPERIVLWTVFSITGTSAVLIVKPLLKSFCDEGVFGLKPGDGFVKGPNTYRALYFAIMWPTYSLLLFSYAVIFGRRIWFSRMLVKMWGRIIPRPVMRVVERFVLPQQPQGTPYWIIDSTTVAAAAAGGSAAAAGATNSTSEKGSTDSSADSKDK